MEYKLFKLIALEELAKVIFKLEGDNTSLLSSLDEINAKYKEQNFQLNRQKLNLKTLKENEEALLAGRSKSQNPSAVAKYNKEIEKTRAKIEQTTKAINEMSAAEVKTGKATEDLGKKIKTAFDETAVGGLKTGVQDLNDEVKAADKPVQSLKLQLRKLKEQLAATNDDEEFNRLSVEAGILENKIGDAAQASRIFAGGTAFERVGGAIRGVGADLLNLNFEGAAQRARLVATAASQITFKESLKGLKDLGSTFLSIGKAILTNPLFLIGGAIAAIIFNFNKLVNLGGPIGAFFGGIAKVVTFVKDALLKFTDLIGATTVSLDKLTKSTVDNLQKQLTEINKRYDQEIKMAQASGKEITQLELDKLKAVEENLNNQILALNNAKAQKGRLNDEELEQHKALQEEIYKATLERKTRELQLKQDFNKLKKDIDKKAVMSTMSEREKEIFIQKEINAQQLKQFDELFNTQLGNEEKNFKKRQLLIELGNQEISKINQKFDDQEFEARREARAKELEQLRKDKQKQKEFEEGGIDDLNRILAEEESKKEQSKIRTLQTSQELDLVNSAQSVDVAKAEAEEKRKIEEKLEQERIERQLRQLTDVQILANATIQASQQIVNAKIVEVDKLRQLQEKRVQDALNIADEGNAELLELEQERLDDLNQQREIFVRRQQQLATLELIANSAIAISKAAAQGGAAAPITIAATLLALIGGLAQARSIASQGAFYEGGYTGDGNPKETSTAVGRKPYTYHKGEFVFNHEKTGKYKEIFQDIHKGNIDLNDWKNKVVAFETMKLFPRQNTPIDLSALQTELQVLRSVIENQYTSLNFNENGLEARFKNIRTKQDFIKKKLARA